MSPVIADRLAEIRERSLSDGNHEDFESGMCVMEAVAYVAGEPWSDQPVCACPVISAFLRRWNDDLPWDADRDRLLKPLVPRLVGTRSTRAVERKRSYMALDWLVRVLTPALFDLVEKLAPRANALRDIPEITDKSSARTAGKNIVAAVNDAACVKATYAAVADLWVTLGDVAVAAAWDAAWDASVFVARDASGAAAWDADLAADLAAAVVVASTVAAKSDHTVLILQQSALELLDRMIEVTP